MTNSNTKKTILLDFLLIGVFAAAAMSASFFYGLTSSNDLPHHFQLAGITSEALSTGEIYPSWAAAANGGYGDVTIRFYPPLSYYFISSVFLLTGDWYYAGLISFFLIFYLGGIGIYLWAREEFTNTHALMAALVYIFAPYHLNQIYNNFLFAEFAASCVVPFCFLFVTRACRNGKTADFLGLSIAYALLILTHLPQTVISSLALGLYALVLLGKDVFSLKIFKLAGAAAGALAASSFYWVRMITELKWVNLSDKSFYTGTFDYRINFLLNPQNVLNFANDELCLWFAELMLLAMLLISVPSIYFLIRERREVSRFTLAAGIVFLISVFMTSQFSSLVWDNAAFLQKVQFPWRWLSVVCLSGSLISIFGITRAADIMNRNKNFLLTCGLGIALSLFVFTAAFVVKQAVYLPYEEFNKQIAGIESRSFHEFWWIGQARSEALGVREKLSISARQTEILDWSNSERAFAISAGAPARLRVATFNYPYWKATVNDTPAEIPSDPDGAILIPVPAESAHVRLYFEEPYFVRFAGYLSAGCWAFFFLLSAGLFLKSRKA